MAQVRDQSTVESRPGAGIGWRWSLASVGVGLLLVTWFFFAWLGLNRNAVDAAGESVGSAFAILAITAIVGAVRHPDR